MSPLIRAITDFIFAQDTPAPADIIAIPGGSRASLPEHAAQLYAGGFAPLILATGGVGAALGRFPGVKDRPDLYPGPYATECAFYADVLRAHGVPDAAILREDASTYTRQNADFSRALLAGRGIAPRTLLIVCKAFHARRCLMCFGAAFPDARILVSPVQTPGCARDDWFMSEPGARRVLGELSRCGSQFSTADVARYLAVDAPKGAHPHD